MRGAETDLNAVPRIDIADQHRQAHLSVFGKLRLQLFKDAGEAAGGSLYVCQRGSSAVVLVEEVVDELCRGAVDAGHIFEIGQPRAGDRFRGAEMMQQRPLA